MPNWTFLTLHFFHMMALVIWVGGMVAIGAIVAPVAFREAPDRSVDDWSALRVQQLHVEAAETAPVDLSISAGGPA